MSELFTSQQHQREEAWCWPLNLDGYDKAPQLSANESAALQKLFVLTQGHIYPRTKQILQRLVRPIDDALTAIHASPLVCRETLRLMLFAQRYGRVNRRSFARRHLPVLGYLLKVHPQIERFVEMIEIAPLARDVFGKEAIGRALQAPFALLQSWGYSLIERQGPVACLCYLLLRNASPSLELLSFALLDEVSHTCALPCVQHNLFRLSRALCALGIIEQPLPDARLEQPQLRSSHEDLAPEWLS